MTLRQRFLQFSLRSMLLATFASIVVGQTYRIVVHDRRVRAERAALEAKITKVIADYHDRPPRCAVLFLGHFSRDLDQSPVYQNMPAKQRSELGSRIEAERYYHFARGDQWAAMKGKRFTKAEDHFGQ